MTIVHLSELRNQAWLVYYSKLLVTKFQTPLDSTCFSIIVIFLLFQDPTQDTIRHLIYLMFNVSVFTFDLESSVPIKKVWNLSNDFNNLPSRTDNSQLLHLGHIPGI